MRKYLAVVLSVQLLLCTGCSTELYDRLLVHAIGVDRTEGGYTVTVRAARDGEEEQEDVFSGEGESVYLALDSIKLKTGKKALYSHNYLVILGKSCCEEGVDAMLDFFSRHFETRPSVKLFMAENTAEEVLRVRQEDELIASDAIEDMIDQEVSSGSAVSVRVLDFVNARMTPGMAACLPVLAARENVIELTETAVFRDDRLADTLSAYETGGLLAVLGQLSGATYVLKNQTGTAVSVYVDTMRARLLPSENSPVQLCVQLHGTADIVAFDGEGGWNEQSLVSALKERISGQIEAALEKALRKNRCDIFGLGLASVQKHPSFKKELEQNAAYWAEKYSVDVRLDLKIVHIGGEITPFS